jgi:hypothetical protein
MITAAKAYDALVRAGFASSYKKSKLKMDDVTETCFDIESDSFGSSNETYGKKSFLYFRCKSEEVARKMIDVLRNAGGKPSDNWNGGVKNKCFQMQVSFFKGHKWWE